MEEFKDPTRLLTMSVYVETSESEKDAMFIASQILRRSRKLSKYKPVHVDPESKVVSVYENGKSVEKKLYQVALREVGVGEVVYLHPHYLQIMSRRSRMLYGKSDR